MQTLWNFLPSTRKVSRITTNYDVEQFLSHKGFCCAHNGNEGQLQTVCGSQLRDYNYCEDLLEWFAVLRTKLNYIYWENRESSILRREETLVSVINWNYNGLFYFANLFSSNGKILAKRRQNFDSVVMSHFNLIWSRGE